MIRETFHGVLGPLLLSGLLGAASCRGPILPPDPRGNLALWLDRKPGPAGGAPIPSAEGKAGEKAGAGKSEERSSQSGSNPGMEDLPSLPPEKAGKIRKEAEALLAKAMETQDPEGLPPGLRLLYSARKSWNEGDLDGAAVDLQDRLAQDPGDFLALADLGAIRLRQGSTAEALALLERALRRAPGDPRATLELAQALAARGGEGDLARGEALLKSIPSGALKPGLVEHVLYLVYLKAGKQALAVRTVSLGLEKHPKNLRLLGDQIEGLVLLGRLEEALQVADRLSRPPDGPLPQALWWKVHILRRLGRFREAVSALIELLRGKGPEFDHFFSTIAQREVVNGLLSKVRREERAGRRLFYFPNEREEILNTDPDEIRRLQVVQSLERALPRRPFRILDLALSDRSPLVRTAALQVLGRTLLGTDQAWERIKKAMGDGNPRVRGMAAHMIGRSHRPGAAGLLLFGVVGLGWFILVILKTPGLLDYLVEKEFVARIFSGIHHRNSRCGDSRDAGRQTIQSIQPVHRVGQQVQQRLVQLYLVEPAARKARGQALEQFYVPLGEIVLHQLAHVLDELVEIALLQGQPAHVRLEAAQVVLQSLRFVHDYLDLLALPRNSEFWHGAFAQLIRVRNRVCFFVTITMLFGIRPNNERSAFFLITTH